MRSQSVRVVVSVLILAAICVFPVAWAYAAVGGCSQQWIDMGVRYRCENLVWCASTASPPPCVGCDNPINCPSGIIGYYCKWETHVATGTCQSMGGYGQYGCFKCPGELRCAEGPSYEDTNCVLSACAAFRTVSPNSCTRR